jgi:hypothetical protein
MSRFHIVASVPLPPYVDRTGLVNGFEVELVARYRSARGRRGGNVELADYPDLVRVARALRAILLLAPQRKVA